MQLRQSGAGILIDYVCLLNSHTLARQYSVLWIVFGNMFSAAFTATISTWLGVFGHRIYGHEYVFIDVDCCSVHRVADINLENQAGNTVGCV